MNRVYCQNCGRPVERVEVDMEHLASSEPGRVSLTPPKLMPCGHYADAVSLGEPRHYDEDIPEALALLRRPLMYARSPKPTKRVLVDPVALRIVVDALEELNEKYPADPHETGE